MQRYLAAAERVIDKVLHARRAARRANVDVPRRFPPAAGDRPGPWPDATAFSRITLYDVIGADKPEGAYGPIMAFKEGVPFDGYLRDPLQGRGASIACTRTIREFVGTDPDEPLRLGIVAGN